MWGIHREHSQSPAPALLSLAMNPQLLRYVRWFADSRLPGPPGYLLPRWLFLRALGVIYFSAFYSLAFQIRGLIGPEGLLPAGRYLKQVAQTMGASRYWYVPTLLWFNSADHALMALCWIGMIASVLVVLNLWPRATLLVCFVLFLSFISAAQDFSSYQSDGMLLTAGFVSLFFAPPGLRPGFGEAHPPSRGSLFLLQLLWFTIYFESGVAKFFGGDPSWHNLTAMDQYYQNGPLPTWIGWYAQQLPHWFHAATVVLTLVVELLVVWMLFLPRRFRIVCFWIVTLLQIGIILTGNYAFLNYLVLSLGILLVDDSYLVKFFPQRWVKAVRENLQRPAPAPRPESETPAALISLNGAIGESVSKGSASSATHEPPATEATHDWMQTVRTIFSDAALCITAAIFVWLLYANLFILLARARWVGVLPAGPVALLEPFRIAGEYGLFGRMTWKRFEIEFQGSNDGQNWTPYPFRNKPQNPAEAPRIYAPYQPRFDWNLWFASLGEWRENPWVLRCEQLLLQGDRDVEGLFAENPFPNGPPQQVRAVLWQYWFTDRAAKRATGMWWRREDLGLFAPSLERLPSGSVEITAFPGALPEPP
jgi:lipase maturation factor 1